MNIVGLFAGIGGIERGLAQAGHKSLLLVEKDEHARTILSRAFTGTEISADVQDLKVLPGDADLLAAGFPCQDLSPAGKTVGIHGAQSGLVRHVFTLLASSARKPDWVLLENVPFMLHLGGGSALRYLTSSIEELGYRWAYRVVNTLAFGLPQRRQRVILLASRKGDPRDVLLADDAAASTEPADPSAFGFYWTEGNRGVGWAAEATPPLKGGSGLSIPSAPAIWFSRTNLVACPDIRDAERLQGFPAGWTAPGDAEVKIRLGHRWRLVGNAVSTPVARWVGERLRNPGRFDPARSGRALRKQDRLPSSAWGERGRVYPVGVSQWPVEVQRQALSEFLTFDPVPLSEKAAAGFLRRAKASSLRFHPNFLDGLAEYVESRRAPSDQTAPAEAA